MPDPAAQFINLLTQAELIAATGPISPAGRWTFRGISAAVADLPPAPRCSGTIGGDNPPVEAGEDGT